MSTKIGKPIKVHTNNPEETIQKIIELGFEENKINKIKNGAFLTIEETKKEYEWYGLPNFNWNPSSYTLTKLGVKVKNEEEKKTLIEGLGGKYTKNNYIHYLKTNNNYNDYEYEITHEINPTYPVYVLSKGRWEKRKTIRALEEMKCPYKVVIEEKEYDQYSKVIDPKNILTIPEEYFTKDETWGGGIPGRNFIWEHSVQEGHNKHWVVDDNINGFCRWNYNVKKKVKSGSFFKVMEDYAERYSNIGLLVPNYSSFVPSSLGVLLQYRNSKCYSCILINTELLDKELEERWRGKYNEDVDLCFRVLEKGIPTLVFNNFTCNKETSGTNKGGNTDTIYQGGTHEGYQKKLDEIVNRWKHTEYIKITTKKHVDARPHFSIDWKKHFGWVGKPKLKEEYKLEELKELPDNEYNMKWVYKPKEKLN